MREYRVSALALVPPTGVGSVDYFLALLRSNRIACYARTAAICTGGCALIGAALKACLLGLARAINGER